jgi:hypothetical protein
MMTRSTSKLIRDGRGAAMPRDIMPLDDGSVLLLDGPAPVTSEPTEGTLGGEVVHFVIDAIAGGVTFDVLKRIAGHLPGSRQHEPASADTVRDTVTEYLFRSGYAHVDVTELRKVGSSGWTVEGTADGDAFHALSDITGVVTHVRLG